MTKKESKEENESRGDERTITVLQDQPRFSKAVAASRRLPPCFTCFCSSTGLLGDFRRVLSLGLASNTPLSGNKVGRLCLFWIDFGFKLVYFKFIQSIKHKFSLSFFSRYFMFVIISLIQSC